MNDQYVEKKKFDPAAWAKKLLDGDDADLVGIGTKALLIHIVQLDQIGNDQAAIANMLTEELMRQEGERNRRASDFS